MSLTDALAISDCPACKRYVGKISVCPYCDVDIPIPATMQRLRFSALAMISIGLPLLWLAASSTASGNTQPTFMSLPDLHGRFYSILKPHLHWLLWGCTVWFMLTGHPHIITPRQTGWQQFLATNRPIGTEILVFLLCGLTGFIVIHSVPHDPAISLLALIPVSGFAMLPLLYDIRARSLLGILLIPLACSWSGLSPALAATLQFT